MTPHRLSVDDLQVASFSTVPESDSPTIGIETFGPCFTDPTAMTWCYYCPPKTMFPDDQQQF